MSEALNKVDEKIKAYGALVAGAISYDDDGNGVLPETFTKDNLAVASGSEELTMETVKLVHNTGTVIAAGLALGLGDSGLVQMQKNKDLARVTASLEFGNDVYRAAVDRQVMVRAPGATEEKPKYGAVSVKQDSGAAAKRGDLKRVMNHLQETFTGHFGK